LGKELEANYKVSYLEASQRETKRLLKKPEQHLFCVEQAKLLRFFPARSGSFEDKFFNLNIRKVEHYWELKVWDKILGHINIRIMFTAFSKPKAIFILCIYAKKTQITPLRIKVKCRHRIRKLIEQGYKQ